jgi:hypothetical protein
MAAKAPEAPLTESQRIVKERKAAALAQAKAQKAADVGLFGDLSVVFVPPDPAKEEPPADEPLSEEDREIERAYQEATAPVIPADVAAVEIMAGAQEEPSPEQREAFDNNLAETLPTLATEELTTAEELEAAHEAAEDAKAAQASREAYVEHVLEPMAEAIAADLAEPLGPESFGGSDEESHLMSQTSAARMREELAAGGEEALGLEKTSEALTSAADVASVAPGASSPQPAGFSLFGHNLFGDEVKAKSSGPLAERFKLPPFTVFDARQGVWQDRKRAWLSLGIQSEVGRGENLLNMSDTVLEPDPVKRAEMIKQREKRNKTSAFGQEFILGAQPGIDGKPGGQGKAWHTNDTGISRKLAPGGGGGGAWIGGPKTSSSEKYGREGEADVVLDENGQPLASKTGTSIFDPVLTELLYSWFVPPAGDILDPFAGGSVRGIVAAKLGRRYVGIELRAEQIAANERQAAKICVGDAFQPTWIEGDSTNAAELTDGALFDFVMACPPYGDLEQYSEDPRDLSNMTYEAFAEAYTKIIAAALARLKPDRFACFVVGDIRDKAGIYRGFPELTVRAFEEAGGRKYNEAILVTSVGSLPIRISKQFGRGRKLGKTHQNVLCFVKGDPFRAAEACGGQAELSL